MAFAAGGSTSGGARRLKSLFHRRHFSTLPTFFPFSPRVYCTFSTCTVPPWPQNPSYVVVILSFVVILASNEQWLGGNREVKSISSGLLSFLRLLKNLVESHADASKQYRMDFETKDPPTPVWFRRRNYQ